MPKRQREEASAAGAALPPPPRKRARTAAEWGGERPQRPERFGNFDIWPAYNPVSPSPSCGAADGARVFRDPRLAGVPRALFSGAAVLDVGCGAGYLAIEIAAETGAHSVLGVDVDGALLAKARALLRYCRAARTAPAAAAAAVATVATAAHAAALPASLLACQRWHAPPPAPQPTRAISRDAAAPDALSRCRFLCQDFTRGAGWTHASAYDVVVCFNVSKWVHLQGGDEAVRALFFRAHEALRPGGRLLLIAQPWRSYLKSRSLRHAFAPALARIRMRPSTFLAYLLEEVGFGLDSVAQVRKPVTADAGAVAQLLILRKL